MDTTMLPPLLLILLGASIGFPLGWSCRETKRRLGGRGR
jgi:hypothetical protein